MFTQCPDCRSVYALDSGLNPEDKTRMHCNACAKDFNVLELLTENPQGLLPVEKPGTVAKSESTTETKPKTRTKKKRKNRVVTKTDQAIEPATHDVADTMPALTPVVETIFIPALTPETTNEDCAKEALLPWEKQKQTFSLRDSLNTLFPSKSEESRKTSVNEVDSKLNQSLRRVKADQIEGLCPWAHTVNWHFANLVGSLLLLGQLVFFSADDFGQSPAYRPYLEKLCQLTGCELSDYANINEFEVLQGSFKTNADKSITFKAVISNQAPFRQSLPYVKLTLVDYEEHLFAQRYFKPAEYLAAKSSSIDIGPDESMDVLLTIAEPKTPIGGYFFDLTY